MSNSTERFSSRVENYIRYRPGYPREVIGCLAANCGLAPGAVVADIGSGTGILTEMFLLNGNVVHGVEPNREMREAGERLLSKHSRFTSIAGTAEATTLPPASVDLVAAGQAFHWFDQDRARAEFQRILRPGGWVVLVWNDRRETSTPFVRAYEGLLLRFATDYEQVNHRRIDENMLRGFLGRGFGRAAFENSQAFDFEGLRGRLLSSSYAPEEDDERHAPMLIELRNIFEEHQEDGMVAIEYDTSVYFGQLGGE